ncbi:MAG: hypothetical protein ABS944_09515 [Solibacillus sp.]|uniref:hypothetical protein n=1 Tax=Solibacillus sp. TaxID=1909654 RepID=UPI0033160EC6
MGGICPCGVKVDGTSFYRKVGFNQVPYTVIGDLTYKAEVCISNLANSTLTLRFDETGIANKYSFLFTANAIKDVICRVRDNTCIVTVTGTGTIESEQYPFTAEFVDKLENTTSDFVESFVIEGFFSQLGIVPISEGAVVSLGCQN